VLRRGDPAVVFYSAVYWGADFLEWAERATAAGFGSVTVRGWERVGSPAP
jgi:hypothetical protein